MGNPRKKLIEHSMRGAGFYSWSLQTNILTADKAYSDIYEIDERELAHGLPVEKILARIVDQDRPRLAARIHDVILGGQSFVSSYGIFCPSGCTKALLSMGSCSKDANGDPSIYTGVVLVEENFGNAVEDVQLESQISAAIDLARNSKRDLTERYLISALNSLLPADK
ncbi:PAS domain-containing protein [Agrobacterium bohemicum]|uniref:PAS fold-3 domain-containing protein n=1 Tax=Agrobacterium bohemicum TaxID=2052828 RepID=A0A135P803_9HYPH|nr:PAS domain-containing protein [Agrobacterium bohemicum]KXG87550.1 hypothetical protein ATO67_18020 [Agrobacterium bohemicum]